MGPATLYPSNINVTGLTGTVSDVNVTLHGMNNWRGDFEILLVSPGGARNLVLLSDAGTGDVSNFTLTFDDSAAALLPQNTAWGPSPLTAKPTNYTELSGAETSFPSPAPTPLNNPAPAGSATLASAFNGIAPNGNWSLYVVNDACDDPVETITGGWTIDISTAGGAGTNTTVVAVPNPSTTGQSVTFTATVTSGGNPVTSGTVTFTEGAAILASNVAVNDSGQASFSKSDLAEGNHIITATYNGTAAFATSSGTVNQRVNNSTVVTGNQYCNTGPITVNALPNPATPYPSNIFVTGGPTNLGKVTVTLKNVTHEFPDDIDVLLVGPAGQNLVLVSDAGTNTSNVTATFDDAAPGQLAQAAPWGAPGSTVLSQRTNYTPVGEVDAFPAPAPTPSTATSLATFNGTNANGNWSLYVVSDGAPQTGTIAGGWCIALTPTLLTPTISTSATTPVTIGSSISDTATVTGGASPAPAPTGTVTFTLFGPGDPTCTGAPIFTSANRPLSGGPPPTAASGPFTPTAVGTYRWIAVYSGDTNYTSVTSPCNAANETSVVNQATATISTSATTPVTLGSPITDTATVTGAATPAPTPTGTVTYTLFGPGNPTCTGAPIFTSANRPLGGGPPPTSTSAQFTPTTAGTYNWVAVYSGDANYPSVTSPCGAPNETSVVNQATATIATSAATPVSIGSPISDTATVTGAASPAPAPTGTVTFTLFGPGDPTCTGAAIFTSPAQLLSGGPPPTAGSGPFTPTAIGSYNWVAVYSGDANYGPATSPCGAANETSAVNQASASIATSATTPVTIGSPISDAATVTGAAAPAPTPTGTVTYTLFGPGDPTCAGVPVFTSANRLLGGGPPPTSTSAQFTPTAVGSYNWVAVYRGDANYGPATSPCGAPNEVSVVNQATASIATSATTPVTLGNPISDTATVTGAPAPAPTPTGTVTYTLFGPGDPTCAGAPVFTSPNRLLGGGPPPTSSSAQFTPTAAGTYNWVAVYGGDANYPSVTSPCGAPNETSVVNQATATISTSATTPVSVGSPISDTATVTGAASPAPTPTGTVVFTLFGPGNPTCTGAPIFTSPAQPLAGGPPPTAGSGPFTPSALGTYNWVAVYSGDTNYTPATSPCGTPNETSVVPKASPAIATQASPGGPVPNTAVSDTATVSGGSNPTGNVTFRLYSDPACTTQVFTSTNNLIGSTATSGSFTPASPGTYFWTAVYNGDANNNAATSPCGAPNESVTITKASPTIATQASPGNLLGAAVRDVATLSGGVSPTGDVTFRLFSDNTCTTQVFTSTNPVSGGTATSGDFTPAAAGTYYWTAVYNGDANNNAATSPCGAPNESVEITPFQAPPFTKTITGDMLGPVTVGAGESVLITNARVVGPVTVEPGGALTVVGSRIARGITADAPSFFSLCGTEVSGPSPTPGVALSVTNATVPIRVGDPASGCAGNRFAGHVVLTGNLAVIFGANAVSHNATINTNGPGNTVIKANTVSGTLACSGNNPPPTNSGQVNTAGAKTGQCAAL
ncbi:MAG: beta strand repeat-containing protein [Acidimicrobiales bacterium]